jgi:ATP-dependent protease ClpP protease subunit
MRRPEDRRIFNLVSGKTRFEVVDAWPDEDDDDEPTKRSVDSAGQAQLYLYDEISYWGINAADFMREVTGLGGAPFALHVNSPGGDVFEGLAMLNTLRNYPGHVTAVVDGIAASAASFLIMGADEVVMAQNSMLMIHDAWGLCMGNAADMAAMATQLDRASQNIADIYHSKAGGKKEEWRSAMEAESWYDGDEAKAAGLADSVLNSGEPKKPKKTGTTQTAPAALAYDLSRYRNTRKPTPKAVPDPDPQPVDQPVDKPAPDWAALIRTAFKEAAA